MARKYEDKSIPFGAYKGKLICDIPDGYLEFLVGTDWFSVKFKDLSEIVNIEIEYRKQWNIKI